VRVWFGGAEDEVEPGTGFKETAEKKEKERKKETEKGEAAKGQNRQPARPVARRRVGVLMS
jgi:hypothetical protein